MAAKKEKEHWLPAVHIGNMSLDEGGVRKRDKAIYHIDKKRRERLVESRGLPKDLCRAKDLQVFSNGMRWKHDDIDIDKDFLSKEFEQEFLGRFRRLDAAYSLRGIIDLERIIQNDAWFWFRYAFMCVMRNPRFKKSIDVSGARWKPGFNCEGLTEVDKQTDALNSFIYAFLNIGAEYVRREIFSKYVPVLLVNETSQHNILGDCPVRLLNEAKGVATVDFESSDNRDRFWTNFQWAVAYLFMPLSPRYYFHFCRKEYWEGRCVEVLDAGPEGERAVLKLNAWQYNTAARYVMAPRSEGLEVFL